MNPETLDALILDQALDALPPEVDALLRAYLARDAEASKIAARTRAALSLAGRVVNDNAAPVTLPPFPATVMRRTHRRRVQWQWAGRATTMAACIALGVLLGRTFQPAPSKTTVVAEARRPSLTTPLSTQPSSHFWSVQRWYDLAQAAPRPDPGQVRWSIRLGSSVGQNTGESR